MDMDMGMNGHYDHQPKQPKQKKKQDKSILIMITSLFIKENAKM